MTEINDTIVMLQEQKAAIAEFGLEALKTQNLDTLLQKAAELAASGLKVSHAKVLEMLPAENKLLVRAGVGWDPNVVGQVRIAPNDGSPAGYAWRAREPITSNDLANDPRFTTPELMSQAHIKSTINVLIAGDSEPFGILEVDSEYPEIFTTDDTNFLQGYANLVGATIERLKTHKQLERAVEHKDVLLAELQHRTRNTMQMIASMIHVHIERQVGDLNVIASRVDAVSNVHKRLINHSGVVNFGAYLEDQCYGVMKGHAADRAIELDIECEDLQVSFNHAQPLALVCNEFVVNSLKHAFPKDHGRLSVRLKSTGNGLGEVHIWDDGIGMEALEPQTEQSKRCSSGIGIGLMQRLAEQADTALIWDDVEVGTSMRMTIACVPTTEKGGGNDATAYDSTG